VAPVFLRLGAEDLTLNGTRHSLVTLPPALEGFAPGTGGTTPVLVSVEAEVTSQRLVDLLVVLQSLDWADVSVLG
jgi:biopolymer transport protein ExbD